MVAGKAIVCGRYVIYYEAVVKPGNESRCDMLQILDKVEEKYFASDATVAPGGWCVGVGAATRRACLIVCVSVFCLKGLMHDE